VSYDPVDHILAAANNADTPPFLTFIDTNTHAVLKQIVFDGTNGTPNALGGLEQSQYSPKTGLFYISVPQIGTDPTQGGVTAYLPGGQHVSRVKLYSRRPGAGSKRRGAARMQCFLWNGT
jgi:hypothetical protein